MSETQLALVDRQIQMNRIQMFEQGVGKLIWIITLIAGAISIVVVVSVVAIAIIAMYTGGKPEIPEVLSNWGGIILGLYFGQFVTLLKDYMGVISGTTPTGSAPQPLQTSGQATASTPPPTGP
jgi:hypothetical protein